MKNHVEWSHVQIIHFARENNIFGDHFEDGLFGHSIHTDMYTLFEREFYRDQFLFEDFFLKFSSRGDIREKPLGFEGCSRGGRKGYNLCLVTLNCTSG